MELHWTDGFIIEMRTGSGSAVLRANREGLLSLAGHLAALADAAPGSHIHLDETNSLEHGSAELVIEKIPDRVKETGEAL